MKNVNSLALALLLNVCPAVAQGVTVNGPDQKLQVALTCQSDGGLPYSAVCDGKPMLKGFLNDLYISKSRFRVAF